MDQNGSSDSEKTSLVEDCGKEKKGPQDASVCGIISGYAFTFLYALGTVLGSACAQALGGVVPPLELNFWRYLCQFLFSLIVMVLARQTQLPKKESWPWLVVVAISSSGYNLFYYTASLYMSLGTLGGLHPSFVVIIIALGTLVFSRDCSLHVTAAVLFCVAGILLIVQPDFMFSHLSSSHPNMTAFYDPVCVVPSVTNVSVKGTVHTHLVKNSTHNATFQKQTQDVSPVTNEWLGYSLLVAGATSISISHVTTSKKVTYGNPFGALMWICAVATVLSGIPMAVFENVRLPSTPVCGLLLVGHALGAGGGSVLAFFALRRVNPLVFSIIQSSTVPMMFVAQNTAMKNIFPGKQNYLETIGSVFVILGIIISPVYKLYTQLRKEDQCSEEKPQ